MSVVSVNKTYEGRGGTDTISKQREYHEVWEVYTNNHLDDEEVAGAAPGLPRLGQPHAKFPFALCVSVNAEQSDDNPCHWSINIRYDSNIPLPNGLEPGVTDTGLPGGAGPGGELQSPTAIPDNPLLRPPVWSVSFVKTTEPATKWYEDVGSDTLATTTSAIRNSAKMPFDPPITIEVSRPVVRITFPVPNISLPFLLRLESAVNDRPWRGYPKWTCKVDGVTAANKYENGIAYVELSIDISIRRETWLLEVLDQGLYTLDEVRQVDGVSVKLELRQIRDSIGGIATEPQLLDGKGKRLAADATPKFFRGLPTNLRLENFTDLLGF